MSAAASPSRVRRIALPVLVAVLATTTSSLAIAPDVAAVASVAVAPTADAFVQSGKPTTNYGTNTGLRVRRASNEYRSYVSFEVAGVTAPVTSAVLRLFVTDASPSGGAIHTTATGWGERAITWNTKPAASASPVATAGAAVAGTWLELDVTSAVAGNGAVSFGILPISTNSVIYSSREGANPPQLVVSFGSTGAAPVAAFTADQTSGTAPLAVTFTDSSTGNPTAWAWDFQSDGVTDSTAQNPTFTFSAAGAYDVKLTATNTDGSDDELKLDYITVTAASTPPTASFTGSPTDGTAPLTVTFTDTSTGSPTAWAWDFEDDGRTDSTTRNPVFTYDTPGLYDVRLTVTNGAGTDSQVAEQFVTVGASTPPPVADFSGSPVSGTAPLAVTFTDLSTGSPTSWAWDFQNDGVTDSTARNPTFTYAASGTYAVKLAATNAGGTDTEIKTGYVSVAGGSQSEFVFNAVADAQVKSTSPTGNYGTATTLRARYTASEIWRFYVKFTVSGLTGGVTGAKLRLLATDPSPVGGSVYLVDSGWTESGVNWSNAPAFPTTPPLSTVGPVAIGDVIEFDLGSSITGNGTYSFGVLTSSGDSVLYSSKEGGTPPRLVLSVAGSPPPAPTPSFTATPTSGNVPLTVQFTDTSTNAPTSWAWDFDGNGSVDSTVPNPMHTYTTAGTYSVSLTVGNSGGSATSRRADLISAAAGPPSGPGDQVLVGAGDIAACSSSGDEATAALLDGIAGTVFTAGDNVYETGTAAEFSSCYEPSWGRHKARTKPSAGNHDYGTAGAAGYFGYFGAAAGDPAKGYYSFDLGAWHIVVLNSNCSQITGGCAAGGAQETWLRQDLAASTSQCTAAIWHHPRFSSGQTTGTTSVAALWQALYEDGAELIINGHAHIYERMAPQTPAAVADSGFGIRQFIIGTGGKNLTGFGTTHANSEVRNNTTFGVGKFTLHESGYSWQFVPTTAGGFTDSGSAMCHGAPV